jgi:preprotein translocase subunit SecG
VFQKQFEYFPLAKIRFWHTFPVSMNLLFWSLIILHVILCSVLILLVLIQNDKAGGLSSAFGGAGSSQAFTSAGAATFVGKLTKWWAGALLAVVVIINLIISHGGMAQTHSSKVKEALETGGAAKVLRDAGAPEVPGAAKIPGLPQGN